MAASDRSRYRCLPEPGPDTRTLHFLRHGEARHQVRNEEAKARGEGCACFDAPPGGGRSDYVCPYWSEDLIDSRLTARGREQTRGRGADLPVELILTSPMARTLESALLAFPQPVPRLALPELRPRVGAHRHSRRGSLAGLREDFPGIDLSRVHGEEDPVWRKETEPREDLEGRAARFLELVFDREERDVAVVTHFTVMLALLLPPSDDWILGPSARPHETPALLDCRACPDPLALRSPMEVGEVRSLVVGRCTDAKRP